MDYRCIALRLKRRTIDPAILHSEPELDGSESVCIRAACRALRLRRPVWAHFCSSPQIPSPERDYCKLRASPLLMYHVVRSIMNKRGKKRWF